MALNLLSTSTDAISFYSPFIMILVMVLFMWLFIYRPQKKQQQKRQQMLDTIAKGTRVMLNTGMFGTVVEVREKSKGLQRFKDIVEVTGGRLVPEWLDVDLEKLQGTVKELPSREQIDVPVDEMLIVELYSK